MAESILIKKGLKKTLDRDEKVREEASAKAKKGKKKVKKFKDQESSSIDASPFKLTDEELENKNLTDFE